MKTRNGFVSNSSSTSFTFIFKGDKVSDLSNTILKYKDYFNLYFDDGYDDNITYSCNALDVAESIERCVRKSEEDYDKANIISIDDCIDKIAEEIKEVDKRIGIEKEAMYKRWEMELKQDLQQRIDRLRGAKKNGLTSVLIIGFGDNSGQVSGGDIGYCMDYEGRNIDIDEKNFVVFTEQNR